jgi:O-antigen ligase
LLPIVLLYSRGVGDALLSSVAALFLVRASLLRELSWLRSSHGQLALWYWLWLVVCTVVMGTPHSIAEAVLVVRLFLFAAALENWVLDDAASDRRLQLVMFGAASWVVLETWQQSLFGTNIFGDHRWGAGQLTGPFAGPIAGATLQILCLPAFLPPIMFLMNRPALPARLAGILLVIVLGLTQAMIGQRMPMLLFLMSLCITGILVRGLRKPVAAALFALVAAIAAIRFVSPITYHTLVVVFVDRMRDFWATPYALLYKRAIAMVQTHPWLGLGFDGFRDHCSDPRYFQAVPWLPVIDDGSSAGCNIHPHNYWLQIATGAGLPGTLLFAALCIAWLARMGRRVLADGRPIEIALFATFCTMIWPIASTTGLFTVPNAGWFFMTVGWGLALQRRRDTSLQA